MRFLFIIIAIAISAFAAVAPAENPGALRRLLTADEAKQWEAVGRINLGDTGFCTGALIAENLVLTAAHCMFDKTTGDRLATANITFLAGWRDGRAAAYRNARRVVIHRDYRFNSPDRMDRVASDIALIELEQPIRNARIAPYKLDRRPSVGDPVKVVSYAKDRSEAPSLQEPCHVLGKDPGVLVLSCNVNFGASGSPIFIEVDGEPRIASVVSAKAEWNDRKVALGASLGRPLAELMEQLNATDGVFQSVNPTSGTLATQLGRETTSSKFLRP